MARIENRPACVVLDKNNARYPAALPLRLGDQPPAITTIGNLDLLEQELLAVFCSARCPGRLILALYDLAQTWRAAGTAVIGGFHSPLERECLTLLLRGTGPVVVCPARDIAGMRLPAAWAGPVAAGRLLVVSPFDARAPRITEETARTRNRMVAALAGAVFVAHAAPGSKTEAFCRELARAGTPLLTLAGPENANLVGLGARVVDPATGR
jgi:predicted Rossmann fold nucleotide-binding protein DprA/Smf involved in DNA uptake